MRTSNKKRTGLISAFIGVAIIGGGFVFSINNEPTRALQDKNILSSSTKTMDMKHSLTPTTREMLYKSFDPNPKVDNLGERYEKIAHRFSHQNLDEEDFIYAVENPSMWNFDTTPETSDLPLDDTELNDGRRFFDANTLRVAVSLPGDTLEAYLPDTDQLLALNINQVDYLPNKLLNVKGRIEGSTGTFTITQGENYSAGHINTAENTYSFEIHGNKGWVHESGALFTAEHDPVVIEETNFSENPIPSDEQVTIAVGEHAHTHASTIGIKE